MTLTIVADENIAALDQYFASDAHIIRTDGRALQASDLAGADALLVRSVTPVTADLLDGSRIRFVGSATIGTDHIDLKYLNDSDIAFANAPGSNADSVADYVCSTLAVLVPDLMSVGKARLQAGVIGLGEVGSRVAKRLRGMGYEVRAYDPFKSQSSIAALSSLEETLHSDVVSVHVPLTTTGPYPTYRMIGAEQLRKMSGRAILLNTARGNVVDGAALNDWLMHSPGVHAALDVWENEPSIDRVLATRVSIATPHIAGYAYDGKLRGTAMLARAFRKYFELSTGPSSSENKPKRLDLMGTESLNDVLLRAYDVRRDDRALRVALAGQNLAAEFDALRKSYPTRREYGCTELGFDQPPAQDLLAVLKNLGFDILDGLYY